MDTADRVPLLTDAQQTGHVLQALLDHTKAA